MVIDTELKRNMRMKELKEEEEKEQEQREEEKKNKNFVQVYRKNLPEIGWLVRKNGLAAGILFLFMEHMDNKNCIACSYVLLEEHFKVSKDRIRIALKLLKDNGFMGVLKMGTSNVYVLNHEVVWSSWDNQKKYAKLDGVMLVSHSENEDYSYELQAEKFRTLRKREKIKTWNMTTGTIEEEE